MRTTMLTVLLAVAVACGDSQDRDHEHDHEGTDPHAHTAPNGGTLHALGEHFGHLEMVLDPKIGELKIFVLDGGAENAMRLEQKEMVLTITPDGAEEGFDLRLAAQVDRLTGEKPGDTSVFSGRSAALKGVEKFEADLEMVEIKGKAYELVFLQFPGGNE